MSINSIEDCVEYDDSNYNQTQRERLLNANSSMEKSTNKLVQANKMAYDTIIVGEDILNTLGQQHQTLYRVRDDVININDINDNLDDSNRILTYRIREKSCTIALIILVIIMTVILIVYLVAKIKEDNQ
jgi:vesicle transport through interaction with t-SNAREs protein 1